MPRGRKPKTATPVLTPIQQELMGVYSVKHDETVALYKDLAKIKDLLTEKDTPIEAFEELAKAIEWYNTIKN